MNTLKISSIEDINALSCVEIKYQGETVSKDGTKWKSDQWSVEFLGKNGFTINYRTGLGLRDKKGSPKKPKLADIFYCMVSDASCLDTNMNDWLEGLGYNPDSIKDVNLYNECVQQSLNFVKWAGRDNLEALKELLQDY